MENWGTVLITGAAGTIGSILRDTLRVSFGIVSIDMDMKPGVTQTVDVADVEALDKSFAGLPQVDYVVHLAANPHPTAGWDEISRNNIIGTRNVYECARTRSVRRVVFASSTHLFGAYDGYPRSPASLNRPIRPDDPPRPDSDYAASKGYGELLARQYYDIHGLESICLRLGSVTSNNRPTSPYERLWLSHADTAQVFERALLSPSPFGRYFATSDNEGAVFDLAATICDLGFIPQDSYTARPT